MTRTARRLSAILLSAAALTTWPASAEPVAPSGDPPTAEDGYFQAARRVADRVHVLVQPRPFHLQPTGNVTVVEQADGLVLVDTGGSPGSGERVVALVREISAKPVKAVIVTHWHGDHPLGLPAILRAWPQARVIATAATHASLAGKPMATFPVKPDPAWDADVRTRIAERVASNLGSAADPALSEAERQGFAAAARELAQHGRDLQGAFNVAPTETFADRLVLADAAAPVEIQFLGRANTDGDAVVWLPKQRVLVTGDVVVAPIPFGFGSYPGEWIAVLERLKTFDFAVLVPGHGLPQTDRVYLDKLIGTLSDVRAQVGDLAGRGLSLEAVRDQADFEAQTRVFAGDDAWLRRWFGRYWLRPITTSAYKEATGQTIVQGE